MSRLDRQRLFSPYLSALLAQKAKLQVDVVELPDEFAAGSLDNYCPPLQPHLDCYHTEQINKLETRLCKRLEEIQDTLWSSQWTQNQIYLCRGCRQSDC